MALSLTSRASERTDVRREISLTATRVDRSFLRKLEEEGFFKKFVQK